MCLCTIITQTSIWVQENISKLEAWLFVETLVRTFLFLASGLVGEVAEGVQAGFALSHQTLLTTRLLRLPFEFWNINKLQLNCKIICSVCLHTITIVCQFNTKPSVGRLANYLFCDRVLFVALISRYVDQLFSSVVLTSLNRAQQISYFKHTPDAAGALCRTLLGCLVEWTLVSF